MEYTSQNTTTINDSTTLASPFALTPLQLQFLLYNNPIYASTAPTLLPPIPVELGSYCSNSSNISDIKLLNGPEATSLANSAILDFKSVTAQHGLFADTKHTTGPPENSTMFCAAPATSSRTTEPRIKRITKAHKSNNNVPYRSYQHSKKIRKKNLEKYRRDCLKAEIYKLADLLELPNGSTERLAILRKAVAKLHSVVAAEKTSGSAMGRAK